MPLVTDIPPGELETLQATLAEAQVLEYQFARSVSLPTQDRYEQALKYQPDPGEKPLDVSDRDIIFRMKDGSMVHQTKNFSGVAYYHLPSSH